VKRWIIRLVAGLLSAAIVVAVLAWLTLRASLPELDGEIAVDGIESAVVIERDDAGIPTITAGSRLDLAFATGFVHGQDRFFQMDLIRRDAAGELSEIIGTPTVAADRRNRLHRFRSRAVASISNLSANDFEILETYANGVNAGLGSLGAKPFEYYVLGTEPEPWLPEDSMLVGYAMFLQLNDERATRDVRRGMVARILPRTVYEWMYPSGTPWDAPLLGEPRTAASIPTDDVYSLRDVSDSAPHSEEQGRRPLNGSNNFAVSGKLTASGRAIVSNDMHLGLDVPNIYYRARLISTDPPMRDVSGVSLPGEPFIVAGSNGKVAWGFTNSYGDWSDAILIRPGDEPNTYRTPDGDQSFKTYVELIEVKGGDAVEHRIRETIWGPVVEDAEYPDGEVAVSWIAHFTDVANLRIMDLETANSVEQALDIANLIVMPPQNIVAGDAEGNIGWTIAGQIPIRVGYNSMLPADWSEAHGWQGWLAAEDYPRIVNPDSGRIWTANSRVVDGEALQIIGDGGYDLGARATQIRDSLFAKDQFKPEDMLAIQIDDRALFLGRWQSLLLAVLDDAVATDDPELVEYHRLVRNWIPRAAAESVGYRLVRAFRLEVQSKVFHALTAPIREAYGDDVRLRLSNQFEAPLWSLVTEQPSHLLPTNHASWNDFLMSAVRENLRYFKENFDGPLRQRTWGERNMATIQHPLSRAIPALSDYLDMPREPLSGDSDMPKAQGRTFGASERFAVYPGDEANSVMHMPGGQSGHPLSYFYRSGHRDWVEGRPAPFLPGAARHKLILQPATR